LKIPSRAGCQSNLWADSSSYIQANSIGVAIRQQPRDSSLLRIELTRDQLTPPKLEVDEDAIGPNSSHDSALKRLRDHLWLEIDESAPQFYATYAHIIDRIKVFCESLERTNVDSHAFAGLIAEPDKLGTADVSVKDDTARWLMHQKQQSLAALADRIRHAARTLELISGRRFHHVGKLEEAQKLLELHGQ
jgi:hypothetical protein